MWSDSTYKFQMILQVQMTPFIDLCKQNKIATLFFGIDIQNIYHLNISF